MTLLKKKKKMLNRHLSFTGLKELDPDDSNVSWSVSQQVAAALAACERPKEYLAQLIFYSVKHDTFTVVCLHPTTE